MMKTCVFNGTLCFALALCGGSVAFADGGPALGIQTDPFFTGQFFRVSDSPAFMMEGLDVPASHFAARVGILFDPSDIVFSASDTSLGIEELYSTAMSFSFRDYSGDWHTYDSEIHGSYLDWYSAAYTSGSIHVAVVTTQIDQSLSIVYSDESSQVPAPSGAALLGFGGVICARRRRR